MPAATDAVAAIQIKGLLGDCLATQIGWAHLHPGRRVSVVVPENGPYEYLRHVWEMSSLSAEVILLSDAQVSSPTLERRSRRRAAEMLRSRGHERLVTFPSEDFGVGRPEEFYAPWFTEILPSADSLFHHYGAPGAIRLSVPEHAIRWAHAFLDAHGIRDFVIVHNRETAAGARMRDAGSTFSDPFWNDMRNHRLEPVVDAALRVLPAGTFVVRIGIAGQAITPRPRFVDTIPLALDLCRQMALLSLSRSYLGAASGPLTFAWLLQKPLLIVNNPLIGGFLTQEGIPTVGLEKHILVQGDVREPTEVCMLDGGGAPGRLSPECGYALEENTPAEIETALVELERLMAAGVGDHLVLSTRGLVTLAELTSRYTGFVCNRQTGVPQVFMAFERAIHEAQTPLMQRLFSRFVPTRPARVGLLGASRTGRQVLADLRGLVSWEIRFFDNDPSMQDTVLDGVTIDSPAELSADSVDLVVITVTPGRWTIPELDERLTAQGWVRGLNLFHSDDDAPADRHMFSFHPDLCRKVQASAERYLGERLLAAAS